MAEYGSETHWLELQGRIITQEETQESIMDYLKALGIQNELGLNFQFGLISPTSVTHDTKTGKSKLNVGLPIEYRENRMRGVLHHEIGTHYLRRHNEKYQPWYKKRELYKINNCIKTEEGFACVNQLTEECNYKPKRKAFLFRTALNYYTCYQASKMSFQELFDHLEKYIDDPKRRWKVCCRVKRAMEDTSEPGGLYKD